MRNFWAGVLMVGVILCSLWLQINVFNNIPLWGARANLGIILVVSLSILCGQGIGISIGIFYGVMSDILFGKAFGIYTLLFFLIGLIGGKFSNRFSKENKTAIVLVVLGTTVIFEFVSYLFFWLCYGYDFQFITFWKLIPEGIYHMLITRIAFRFLTLLSELINRGKRSYYLL